MKNNIFEIEIFLSINLIIEKMQALNKVIFVIILPLLFFIYSKKYVTFDYENENNY